MAAFRDPDRAELTTFAQHVAMAETLLGIHRDLTATLHPGSSTEERHAPLRAWDDMHGQLEQARAIAVRFGRDVTAYDAAYARTGVRTYDALGQLVIATIARTSAAEAIDALRAAFPEVIVPRPPPSRKVTPPWRPNLLELLGLVALGTFLLLGIGLGVCGP